MQEALRTTKKPCATLHVDPSNEAAVKLYSSVGFTLDGIIEDYYAHEQPAHKLIKHLQF